MRPSRLIALLVLTIAPAVAAEPDPLIRLRPGHPRLLVTEAQLAAAKRTAATDPLQRALQARIIELAVSELTAKPLAHVLIGPRMLDQSRRAISQILTEAMAYRLTGDTRFSDRARKDLLTVATFADWHPEHYLDVAEMSFAVGIGYDWLYSVLPAAERTAIERAIVEKALSFAPAAYSASKVKDKRLFWAKAAMNWNQVCNGGMLTAALAVADEEPDLAREVIAGVRRSLPLVMESYLPEGAYPEGPGYWAYGTTYNVIILAELEETLGTDFGLGSAPAFDRTAYYRMMVQGPTSLGFNYADGNAALEYTPAYAWLARRYGPPAVLADSRAKLEDKLNDRSHWKTNLERFAALNVVWFPLQAAAEPTPPDVHFKGRADLALFRSAWGDPTALFVGLKGGSNQVNHSHLDLGSFVLDADGERWAMDLGPDNYNLPAYFGAKRWSYYRMNNHSHNTVTVGSLLQNPKAEAPIVAYSSSPAKAFAIVDLSRVYPGASHSLLRGVAVLDRARVLVQDEWEPGDQAKSTPLHWGMVTAAKIGLSPDGRTAQLSLHGKTLQVELLSPADGKLVVESTRPPTEQENQNANTSMLATTLAPGPAGAQIRLAMLLTPGGDKWQKLPPPPVAPLASWK
jgi:hypothetical protein